MAARRAPSKKKSGLTISYGWAIAVGLLLAFGAGRCSAAQQETSMPAPMEVTHG